MKVNIVMLAKDRLPLTTQALDTLIRTTKGYDTTLLVLDDGSQRPTTSTIESYMIGDQRVTVRIGRSKGIVGLARNLGVIASEMYFGRGNLLYLSDNDVYFNPRWLECLLRAWDAGYPKGFRIIGGYNHPYQAIAGAEVGRPEPVVPFEIIGGYWGEIREYYAVGGLSWLMDWDTWDEFGVLECKAVGVAKSEDWEYTQRIRNAGYKVGAVWPHVVYNTGLTSSFGEKAVGHEAMEKIQGVYME